MTFKNAKIILFASLITTMIFSGIQTTEAIETNQDVNDIENLTAYE